MERTQVSGEPGKMAVWLVISTLMNKHTGVVRANRIALKIVKVAKQTKWESVHAMKTGVKISLFDDVIDLISKTKNAILHTVGVM